MSYFIYFVIIVSFIDNFSQLPIISPYAKALGGSSLIIGLAVGMYSFSNMIGNVFAGQFIDKVGRKKIMLIGMIIAGVSLLAYAQVASASQLLLVRFIHGLGGALMVPAAFAYLGDTTKNTNRGKTMALSGAAIGVAAMIGPAFGGVVKERVGIEYVFYFVSFLMLVTSFLVKIYLPERQIDIRSNNMSITKLANLLTNSSLITAFCCAFALMYAKGILAYILPLQLEASNFGAATTGILFSTFAVVAIVIFLMPINFADKFGRYKPMFLGLLLIAIALMLLSMATRLSLYAVAMIIYGSGFALLFPAITALVVDNTEVAERGRAFGLFYAFFSLGVVLGPLLVGFLNVAPAQGFVIGSIGVAIIGILLYFRRNIIVEG
ncbi:MAG: MFS transporter [Bacillota bacterium]|nr:MFS transporter [Bacillota bacterium]